MTLYLLCTLIVAGAQLIYATVGFGAGMFSIALLAMLLPDLGAAVATLFLLTVVTEVVVLSRAWREVRVRLLLGLLPTTAVGMWLGTELLVVGSVAGLKRALGLLIVCAGAWFLHAQRREDTAQRDPQQQSGEQQETPKRGGRAWTSLPTGLAAGALAGLYGTSGPPVIVFLKAYRLDKGAFRATLLWFFLLVSVLRAVSYLRAGLLTGEEVTAALWLLPASLLGMFIGMGVHRRLSERHFATVVSGLLMFLGAVLVIRGGR